MKKLQGDLLRKIKGFYEVMDSEGNLYTCKIKGNLFKNSKEENQVATGDKVEFEVEKADNFGRIFRILPRQNIFSRRRTSIGKEHILAANIDQVIIFASYREPEFKKKMVLLMWTGAILGGASPIVLLNKTDLIPPEERKPCEDFLEKCKMPFLTHSNFSDEDSGKVIELLKNKKSVLSGYSGVGKSSLIKMLFPEKEIRVNEVNQKNKKGKHTTTKTDVYFWDDSTWIIDTPGIKEFQPNSFSALELANHFPVISEWKNSCKFKDCLHRGEPGCKVKAMFGNEVSETEVYELYLEILKELY